MKCIIIGGFLGSGKTTYINYLIEHSEKAFPDHKIALLINEFGEIPVDTAIIEEGNYSMRQVTGGCICCTLKGMLSEAVAELKENENPDLLIIEATGLAVPSEISALAGAAGGCSVFRLNTVDPKQYLKFSGRLPVYDRQFDGEDLLLLTKTDIREPEQVCEVEKALNRGVMRPCFTSSKEAAEFIFSLTGQSSSLKAEKSAVDVHDLKDDIEQFTHKLARPVSLSLLSEALSEAVSSSGEGLFRIKGIVETTEGWKAVQFVDGEISIKILGDSEGKESFIVFIGRKDAVSSIKSSLLTGVLR